ncbi:MAG: XRE family transcriptional regulator [Pseudomonadota bacterium]
MDDMAERLEKARRAAGYEQATDAVEAFGWVYSTYVGHENGLRGFKRSAERYARAFQVSLEWLMTGRGEMKSGAVDQQTAEVINIWDHIPANRKEAAIRMLKGLADDG